MAKKSEGEKNFDGVASVAEMMTFLDRAEREKMLAKLAERDPEIVQRIKEKMFVFEDLAKLSGKDFQLLMQEIPRATLLLALRDTTEELKAHLYQNLSEKAGQLLREELQAQSPRKRSDVQAAQKEICILAKRLGDEGKIAFDTK